MTPFARTMHKLLDQIERPPMYAEECERHLRTIRRMTRLMQMVASERRKAKSRPMEAAHERTTV
jgi:hypothetical protein